MKYWTCLAVAAFAIAFDWGEIVGFARFGAARCCDWHGRAYCGNGAHSDAYRQIVEENLPRGYDLYFCTGDNERLDPVDRTTHLALSWERCPTPVRYGSAQNVAGASAVVASRYLHEKFPGYAPVAANASAILWIREDILRATVGRDGRRGAFSPFREFFGASVVCLVVAACVFALIRGSVESSGVAVLSASVFFYIAGWLALTHTFFAPTGLGVYGGKARLLFLSWGIPHGFFVDAAYSSYQPAYPPFFALLTFAAYVISGGCGEWMTQLIGVFIAGMTLYVSIAASKSGIAGATLLFAFFLCGPSLLMSSLYYAEPLMALFALIGFVRVGEKPHDWYGWLLLGCCGLVKAEGLIVFGAVVVAAVVGNLFRGIGMTAKVNMLLSIGLRAAVAAIAPVAWLIFVHMIGAEFYDYSFWAPDRDRFVVALSYLLRCAFCESWRYAFVYPLVAAAVAWSVMRKKRIPTGLTMAFALFVVCLLGFSYVYSLSTVEDFNWHLETSAVRLLWTPGIVVLVCLLRVESHSWTVGTRSHITSTD